MGANDLLIGQMLQNQTEYNRRLLKIRTKSGKVVPLIANRMQRYIEEKVEEQYRAIGRIRAIVLKMRQGGSSTYWSSRAFRRVVTRRGYRAYILTHEQPATDNLFEMAQRFYEHLPSEFRPHAGNASAKELYFDKLDSGYSIGTAGAKGTGRSGTFQFFLGSEVAYWPNAADHMAGVGQAVPQEEGTEVVLESTANGVNNEFHVRWNKAVAGDSEYIPIFCPWFWVEEYRANVPHGTVFDDDESAYGTAFGLDEEQMLWRRQKIASDFGGRVDKFDVEYPATPEHAFLAGGDEVFITPMEVARCYNARVEPHPESPLLLGLDVAEYGDDRSVLIARKHRKVFPPTVWKKRGLMELVGLAAIETDKWIMQGEKPILLVDTVGIGAGVADRLLELGYEVVRVHSGEAAAEDHRFINKRAEMWSDMRDMIRDQPFELPNRPTLMADLTAPAYTYDSSRRLQIESKERMKVRLARGADSKGKSPDEADALALTFAYKFAIGPRKKPRRRAGGSNVSRFLGIH